MIEVAKLQTQHGHVEEQVKETRGDMRDARDRLKGLEVRVDHLPSKGFIVGIVLTALVILTGIITIAPKLQFLAGTAPQAQQLPPPQPGAAPAPAKNP